MARRAQVVVGLAGVRAMPEEEFVGLAEDALIDAQGGEFGNLLLWGFCHGMLLLLLAG
jgi:hypothetical protein